MTSLVLRTGPAGRPALSSLSQRAKPSAWAISGSRVEVTQRFNPVQRRIRHNRLIAHMAQAINTDARPVRNWRQDFYRRGG